MNSSDAQKSEVHDTTSDAASSPLAAGDEAATRGVHPTGVDPTRSVPAGRSGEAQAHYVPGPLTASTRIVRDDTDAGGPLVIESDDPQLDPPRVPTDPFPTDGTPQIDPPVEKD